MLLFIFSFSDEKIINQHYLRRQIKAKFKYKNGRISRDQPE